MAQRKDKFGFPLGDINNDAFGRVKSSNPDTLFQDKHLYSINNGTLGDRQWLYVESGGTADYNSNASLVELTTDQTSGSVVIKQSRNYFSYFPGKSQIIYMTGTFASTSEAVEQKIGYFDDNNGIYFMVQSGGNLAVGIRSSTTGSPVDRLINQSDWNYDTFDGSNGIKNESRKTLDYTKGHVFVFDFQWLGMGSVRFGFLLDSELHWAHFDHNSNDIEVPYMATSTLPLRYSIENKATLTSTHTLNSVCATVISEGGQNFGGTSHLVSNGTTERSAADDTKTPILGVRLLDQFNSKDNRIKALFRNVTVYNTTKDAYFEVMNVSDVDSVNGTWSQVNSGVSACEYSVDITSVFGGKEHNIVSDYSPAASKSTITSASKAVSSIEDPFHNIVQNYDSTGSEYFIVYAYGIGGTSTVAALLEWSELQ